MIHTINNTICTLLFHARPPLTYWNTTIFMAIHLITITRTTTLKNISLFKKLYNKPPSYTHLLVSGRLCYPHIPTPHKLSPCSTPCIFLGYPTQHKEYRVLNLHTNSIINSRHVTFYETIFPFSSFTVDIAMDCSFLESTMLVIPLP